jgi:hypothetical protein
MTKILLAACAALALSGCVTAEEMAAKTAAYDDNECHWYGAATGTDAYFQCRMVKSQQRIQASEQAQANLVVIDEKKFAAWLNARQPAIQAAGPR